MLDVRKWTLKWIRTAAVVLATGTAWGTAPGPAVSQPPATTAELPATADTEAPLSIEVIERMLAEVDQLPGLDDTARGEIRAIYQDAIREWTLARGHTEQAARFAQMASGAEEALKKVRSDLASLTSTGDMTVPSDASLAQLESLLAEEEKRLSDWRREKERLESEPGRRASRRAEIPTRLRTVQDALGTAEAELKTLQEGMGPRTDAQRVRLRARIQSLRQESNSLQQELSALSATVELPKLESDLAVRQASLAEKRVSQWRERVEQRRAQDVKQQAEAAANVVPAVLSPLAERNGALVKESEQLLEKIRTVNTQLEDARTRLTKIEQQFRKTKEKVEQVRLTYAIGLLLRRERASLPPVRHYRRNSREREKTIREVQLQIIDLAYEREQLLDVNYPVNYVQQEIGTIPPPFTRQALEDAVRVQIEKQLETLATLQQSQDAYFERLMELESTEQQLVAAVADYDKYIAEHVLWIRSSDPLATADLRCGDSVAWLIDHRHWGDVLRTLWSEFQDRFAATLLLACLWLLLLLAQPRLRKEISHIGVQAASGACRRFSLTLMALVWTLSIAVAWPTLILAVAWRLAVAPSGTEFVKSVSYGLTAAGLYFVTLEFFRQVCRTRGLADSHFHWPAAARTTLRRNLRWLLTVGVPLTFLAGLLIADVSASVEESLALTKSKAALSRLCSLALLAASVVFTHLVFRPQGPLMQAVGNEYPQSRFCLYRTIWYALALAIPLSLIGLASVGYYYTATRLGFRLLLSVLLIEVLLMTLALVRRWLIIAARRIAIERVQRRRALALQQGDLTAERESIALEQEKPDLEAIGEQSRRLINFLLVLAGAIGLWFIWIDVLPALNFLHRFSIWPNTTDPAKSITFGHMIGFAVIVFVTILATKNIPGLLEITVLAHLPVDAANRYAFIAICRYILAITGMIVAFSSIGIAWESYQWLVAAVTVGLGFGLQEIFANFVSGLIVLFEQPIRVGDVVTIGDITGVVSKIRMRATTVTNWDRKEYIVPNKEFITGRLLNWTLSNSVNRITISVGLAYGTDPDRARQILLDVAQKHPYVLTDPAPSATFEEFGDSTLRVTLRCFLPDLENRLATIHELNTAVQREFSAAGIRFAFPTRELYIQSPAEDVPESLDMP